MGESSDKTPKYTRGESDADRLRGTTSSDAMSVDLVSAFAGDREMTEVEKALISKRKKSREHVFFSDLLYAISHHYFAPGISKSLWNEILLHKHMMSERLGRNVRVAVATLDYLSNITSELNAPTLMAEAYVSELADLSMRDGMTGLYNHSTCYELLNLEFRRRRRYGVGVSLILLDIDDFKSVNDQYGHQTGDRTLIALAKAMQAQVRDADICCRFGGEEFVVILPLTDAVDEAIAIAERIRATAMNIACDKNGITISAGVACSDDTMTSSRALIEKADRALYRAKKEGKNRVVCDCPE